MCAEFYIGGFSPRTYNTPKKIEFKVPKKIIAQNDKPRLIDVFGKITEYDTLPKRFIEAVKQGMQRVNVQRPRSSMIDFIVKGNIEIDRNIIWLNELLFQDLVGNYHSNTIDQLEQVIERKVSKFTETKPHKNKRTIFEFDYSFSFPNLEIDRLNVSLSHDSNSYAEIALSVSGNPIKMENCLFENMMGHIIQSMVSARPKQK